MSCGIWLFVPGFVASRIPNCLASRPDIFIVVPKLESEAPIVSPPTRSVRNIVPTSSANAFALDVGTIFRTDLVGGLTIGASLSNFGTTMKMSGRDARQFGILDATKPGTNSQIPQDIEMDAWDLPLLFQIGVSTTPLKTDNYRITIAADALHPNDNYESVNVGGEFAFQDVLFLRGGFNSLGLPDREGGLSLGFGLSSASFLSGGTTVKFDYAFRDMGRLSNINVFSLSARF